MKDFKVFIPDPVIFETLDGEALLLHTETGVYFSLNETGVRIWELILEHCRLGLVKDLLIEEYQVSRDVVERDISALLKDLEVHGLIEVKPV